MKEKILIDGRILFIGAVLVLFLFDFFIRTANIWLENNMLRKKFNYKKKREKKVYELVNTR
jgi:hypothetical protein